MKLTSTIRRKFRIRNKLKKVSDKDRLRLSISRSTKNISAQIIDDVNNKTLLSSSSLKKNFTTDKKTNKTEISKIVAEDLAKKALEKNKGKRKVAAKELGISERTLYRKIKQYGL